MSNRETLGKGRARGCASRLGEYGGKLLTFSEEEIARFLPENITTTTKLQLDVCQLQFEEYLLNYKHCQGTDKFDQDLFGVTNTTVIRSEESC